MKGNYLIIKLFILLMLAPQSGFTQYKSFFGKEVTSWNREMYGQGIIATDSINILSSDTIRIDSVLYYKATNYINGNYQRSLFYYYREDTTKGRLYHYDTSTKTEFLVVDMSLNRGDTFHTNMLNDTFIVDSVYYIIGIKHVLVSNGRSFNILFAEGVGAIYVYISMPGNNWGGGRDQNLLLCQFKDGQHVYSNHMFAPIYYCYRGTRTNTIKPITQDYISVYPNPVFQTFSVEFGKLGVYDVKLVNALGQNVLEEHIHHLAKARFQVNHLPEGIYTLVIFDDNKNNIYKEKIIIQ